jgi:excisionase family DNA binding protein
MRGFDEVDSALDANEAALAKEAHRALLSGALDHSRASKVQIRNTGAPTADIPVIELSPKAMRRVADLLGMLAQQRPVVMFPQKMELSTLDAAHFLNVSRPFVIKQIEEGKLACRKIGRHRRIFFEDLVVFKNTLRGDSDQALQELADQAQELGLEY